MEAENGIQLELNKQRFSPARWATAASLLLLGAAVRFFRVGEQVILDDEWHALRVVRDQDFSFIFSHLGHADHSIPLTLLYEWFSQTTGLSELLMRMPSLLAGTLLIIVFPWLMRPWLKRQERLLTIALLALSPFLVYFSRTARPYALIALLASACLPLAWAWWKNNKTGHGFAWACCSILSAWLNPLTLALTTAPFLWFGVEALQSGFRYRQWAPLKRLFSISVAMLVGIAALLYVPLSNDFQSLAVKSGVHAINPDTVFNLFHLFSGTGYGMVALLATVTAGYGLWVIRSRDSAFAGYLATTALAAGIAVALSGAAWILHGIVLARYLIGLLPVYLALVAIGLLALARRAARTGSRRSLLLPTLAVAGLLISGPMRDWHLTDSQFVNHASRQFDYRRDKNPFLPLHANEKVEAFYADIANAHPDGDAIIVEAPAYLDSRWNLSYLSERVHGQTVKMGFVSGVCADSLPGELHKPASGLHFRNFTWLGDVIEDPGLADYVVLRHAFPAEPNPIEMDFSACETAAREAFGPPWKESTGALVFRTRPGP